MDGGSYGQVSSKVKALGVSGFLSCFLKLFTFIMYYYLLHCPYVRIYNIMITI